MNANCFKVTGCTIISKKRACRLVFSSALPAFPRRWNKQNSRMKRAMTRENNRRESQWTNALSAALCVCQPSAFHAVLELSTSFVNLFYSTWWKLLQIFPISIYNSVCVALCCRYTFTRVCRVSFVETLNLLSTSVLHRTESTMSFLFCSFFSLTIAII
jgi:hypothetical protein